jgi:hypothetical protein
MKTRSMFALLIASIIGAAACNPYDPTLPAEPFRCGSVEPRCPESYSCKSVGNLEVCQATGATLPDAPPTNDIVCNNDSALEPNDATSNAYAVPARALGTAYMLSGIAICPTGADKDYYAITVDANTTNIEVFINYSTGAPLSLSILNGRLALIATVPFWPMLPLECITHSCRGLARIITTCRLPKRDS